MKLRDGKWVKIQTGERTMRTGKARVTKAQAREQGQRRGRGGQKETGAGRGNDDLCYFFFFFSTCHILSIIFPFGFSVPSVGAKNANGRLNGRLANLYCPLFFFLC